MRLALLLIGLTATAKAPFIFGGRSGPYIDPNDTTWRNPYARDLDMIEFGELLRWCYVSKNTGSLCADARRTREDIETLRRAAEIAHEANQKGGKR